LDRRHGGSRGGKEKKNFTAPAGNLTPVAQPETTGRIWMKICITEGVGVDDFNEMLSRYFNFCSNRSKMKFTFCEAQIEAIRVFKL
jgi:hypothetical protein